MKTILIILCTLILFVQVLKGLALLTLYEKLSFLCDALAVVAFRVDELIITGKEKKQCL